MAVGTLDNETVSLAPGLLNMKQAPDMSIFKIIDWKLKNNNLCKEKQGISMMIVMKRKIISEMMTTYFPTLLLTAITFATTFFKPFFFEAALSVNLTTMLVMTTIFMSKMESLPPTSDIKMIDIWLVVSQMVPFAEVVLLTAMEYHRQDKTKEKQKKKRGKAKSKKNEISKHVSINILPKNDNHDRKDEDLEQRGGVISLQMSTEDNGEDNLGGKCCQKCWIPDLKTVGRCIS